MSNAVPKATRRQRLIMFGLLALFPLSFVLLRLPTLAMVGGGLFLAACILLRWYNRRLRREWMVQSPEHRREWAIPPDGAQFGKWYFNRRDIRYSVLDSNGDFKLNLAHKGNWPLLILAVGTFAFILGSAAWYLILIALGQ